MMITLEFQEQAAIVPTGIDRSKWCLYSGFQGDQDFSSTRILVSATIDRMFDPNLVLHADVFNIATEAAPSAAASIFQVAKRK